MNKHKLRVGFVVKSATCTTLVALLWRQQHVTERNSGMKRTMTTKNNKNDSRSTTNGIEGRNNSLTLSLQDIEDAKQKQMSRDNETTATRTP